MNAYDHARKDMSTGNEINARTPISNVAVPRSRPFVIRNGAAIEHGTVANNALLGQHDDVILRAGDIVHRYGNVTALDNVSLDVRRGEFLTILGESGSGKTTMLRVISGLERASEVRTLTLDGVDVTDTPAAKRNCTTVFQSYALFPHMSVEENVAYGLRVRGIPRDDSRKRAHDALAMVRLSDKAGRRIGQLSGGERQRVALARAVVTRPAILLLDEPLGALDERLRIDMQAELVDIHKALGMTFIYITHSQEEALTMSDRIVLMRKGRIEQCGAPEALFDRPVNQFVARFMGFDNVLPCCVIDAPDVNNIARVALGDQVVRAVCAPTLAIKPGDVMTLAVRAERLIAARSASLSMANGDQCVSGGISDAMGALDGMERNKITCTPIRHMYRGKYTDQTARYAGDGEIKIRSWDQNTLTGAFDTVHCRVQDCVLLPS